MRLTLHTVRQSGAAGQRDHCVRPHLQSVNTDGWMPVRPLFFYGSTSLRIGLLALVLLSGMASARGQMPRVFALNPAVLQHTKEAIKGGEERFRDPLRKLRRDADKAMEMGPFSVMLKDQLPPGGDKHEYMSLSRYWWPDPSAPNGLPYIRRDGDVNPEVAAIPDNEQLNKMVRAVSTLSAAYYFTEHEPYAEHAARLIRAWFLDTATAMRPNLRFAQAIRGRDDGRSFGVLDGRGFVQVVDAIGLLSGSQAWTPADQQHMVDWFSEYLRWLLESESGKGESAAENNHGVWYDVQTSAVALFTGRDSTARRIALEAKEKRVAAQIEPDGSMPRELARAISEHYTHFNIQAFVQLAGIAERTGVDLWRFSTPDGRSVRKALEYVLPVLQGERAWGVKQLRPGDPADYYPELVQAARQYPDLNLLPLADAVGGEKARVHVVNLLFGYGR